MISSAGPCSTIRPLCITAISSVILQATRMAKARTLTWAAVPAALPGSAENGLRQEAVVAVDEPGGRVIVARQARVQLPAPDSSVDALIGQETRSERIRRPGLAPPDPVEREVFQGHLARKVAHD